MYVAIMNSAITANDFVLMRLLLVVLLVLAGSRAFDKGLFDKSRQEETLFEGCKNDLKYMILSLGYDLPTFLQDSPDSSK